VNLVVSCRCSDISEALAYTVWRNRPQYSADWGDYVSFAENMRKKADEKGVDLIIVDSGDRIEGNGLYDASDPKGKYTSDIFREQPIDVICTGNHELYQAESVRREHEITVRNYKDSYVASNLDYIEPGSGTQIPQAPRYRKFKTKNQGLTIVAFGFLFDFERGANNSVVQKVEDTLQEPWFQAAIREQPDLFVVSGHVGLRMKEFELIFKTIRDQNWHIPIAFLGGHVHVRDFHKFDSMAYGLASGRYMETIGWMSIDGIKKRSRDEASVAAAPTFKRRYIDNNLFSLYHHSGLNETTFHTEHGKNVTKMITNARKALNLDKAYGCAPQDYWMARVEYPSDTSVFTWMETQVVPQIVTREDRADKPRLAITNTGMIRFDIFKGPFTIDSTYIVSPFVSKWKFIPDVPYEAAKKVIDLLNGGGPVFASAFASGSALDLKWLASPEQWALSQGVSHTAAAHVTSGVDGTAMRYFGADAGQKPLVDNDEAKKPNLISGYTTKDDFGDDGDDTIHEPIQFFKIPNCIQSKIAFPQEGDPENVDLVFVDYVQPWIITALKFSGGDYNADDIQEYRSETVTSLLSNWISDNWKGDC
jgi:2',3'-cyclic-nucleotide 2'-phosphodiesterase (5'-nucleotidase family)